MSLYETLGVDPKAPANEIRKAYLKKARVCHPDKGGDEEEFQALGRAFAVLSDDDRRKLYDTTGAIDDGTGASAGEGDAYRFWRDFYDRVTSEKLDAMAREYKGSAEEAADLAAAYRRAKGDMDKIADDMLFGTADDEPRYRGLLQAMVDAGELPAHRAFTAESAAKRQRRQKRAAAEAAEAEEHARELGLGEAAASGGADALHAAIVARQGGRQAGFDSLVDSLAARYSGGGKGGGKAKGGKAKAKGGGKSSAPPTDEEFERIQAELASRAAKKR